MAAKALVAGPLKKTFLRLPLIETCAKYSELLSNVNNISWEGGFKSAFIITWFVDQLKIAGYTIILKLPLKH